MHVPVERLVGRRTANLDLGDVEVVSEVEAGGGGDWRLDAGSAYLVVALWRRDVADRERASAAYEQAVENILAQL